MDTSSHILMLPAPCNAVSHIMSFVKIGKHAVETRKYNVTMLLSSADVEASSRIDTSGIDIVEYPGAFNRSECLDIAARFSKMSPLEVTVLYLDVGVKSCRALMEALPTMTILEMPFEVLLGDMTWPCSSLAADVIDKGHNHNKQPLRRVLYQGNSAFDPAIEHFGVPSPATEATQLMGTAHLFMDYVKPMSFLYRFANVILREVARLAVNNLMLRPYDQIRRDLGLLPTSYIRSAHETPALILFPMVWGVESPRALPPNAQPIHPVLPEPPKPLIDGELANFVSTKCDGKGIIPIVFGTQASLSMGQVDKISQALTRLSDRFCILWHLPPRRMPRPDLQNLGEHILPIDQWFPQNDVLGHPQTKVFLTHGGYGSLYEAAYHGVPIVAIPSFGDQDDNAVKAESGGWGIRLNKDSFSVEELENAIRKAASATMQSRAEKISSLVRHKSGMEEAVYWIDYARQYGVEHLMPFRAMQSSYLAYYNLDVALVLAGILWITTTSVYMLFVKKRPSQARQASTAKKEKAG